MAGAGIAGDVFDRFFTFRLIPYRTPRHVGPTLQRLGPPACELAIIEFDDQGLLFTRRRMDDLQAALDRLTGRNPVIVVFVHGWKHDAGHGDANLRLFKERVEGIAGRERAAGSSRPVLGVYLAWRGLSRDGNWFWMQSSFWDRRQAAQRVASGSARELLGRLKAFRNGPPGAGGGPHAMLVVIGHSFGGLVVYSAIAQSLIEAAATQEKVTPSFGDLVVLVNPAFSAVSYLPVHEIVEYKTFEADELPVFVSITAENDWATGYAYPLGSLTRLLTEAWRTLRQREALIRTMGHLPWLRTHRLTAAPPASQAAGGGALRTLSAPGTAAAVGPVAVECLPGRPCGPFWVASAAKEVVNGHGDIGNPVLLAFLRELVAKYIAAAPIRAAQPPEPVSLPD